jgi:hypothetical protein
MSKLLDMQSLFPPGIIFMGGARMQKDGLRWAPTSFMTNRENEYALLDAELEPAYFDGSGLQVNYPGFILHPRKSPLNDAFYLLDRKAESVYLVHRMLDPDILPWKDVAPCQYSHSAIICNHAATDEEDARGILVAVDDDEDGCLQVRFQCRLDILKQPLNDWARHKEGIEIEISTDLDEYLYLEGEPLPPDHQWRVC